LGSASNVSGARRGPRTVPPPSRGAGGAESEARVILAWQIGVGAVWLAVWEIVGGATGSIWISRPSLIFAQLLRWARGDLYIHVATTLTEVVVGLLIGAAGGILAGLWFGRSPLLAGVMRPIIVAFYSVPLIALTPLFIMFFGLDMEPKIILVTIVVFFLLFFNTFAGAQEVDADLIAAVDLMGSSTRERFQKVIAPACVAWIIGGVKVALPYALVAATTGEMLAARRGLGFLLSDAASQFDMTALYAALVLLMLLGLAVSEAAAWLERHMLRWRHAAG
jgi:NitT/TauT family transport system permease protein